jgi:hypothetical protein
MDRNVDVTWKTTDEVTQPLASSALCLIHVTPRSIAYRGVLGGE